MRYRPSVEPRAAIGTSGSTSGRPTGGYTSGLVLYSLWASVSAAQMMQRPSTVWGDLPIEQEGLRVGGVEILSTLLISLAVLGMLSGVMLFRSSRLLHRAGLAEGSEIEFLWRRTEQEQKWASRLAYGLQPLVGALTVLMAPARTLMGVALPQLAFGLFLFGALLSAVTFLILEAVRRRLGAEKG